MLNLAVNQMGYLINSLQNGEISIWKISPASTRRFLIDSNKKILKILRQKMVTFLCSLISN